MAETQPTTVVYVDRFDSAGDLRGKARTYEAVKAAVLEAGRFSVFEATDTPKDARIFEQLCRDPELETYKLGFPWTGIRRKSSEPLPEEARRIAEGPQPKVIYLDPDADPYRDRKPYHHLGAKIDGAGNVSPLCARRPRALNLKRDKWTLQRSAVTCKRCLAIMAEESKS